MRRLSQAVSADESVDIECVVRVKSDVKMKVRGRIPIRHKVKSGNAAYLEFCKRDFFYCLG